MDAVVRVQGCCQKTAQFAYDGMVKLVQLIKKVVEGIAEAFIRLAKFVFCIQPHPPLVGRPPLFFQPFPPFFQPLLPSHAPWQGLPDVPVDLDHCRRVLRNGYGVAPLSSRMTPRDFITLINEFPTSQTTIGQWAETWANARLLKVDPAHPYYEMFQAALQHKNNIDGGAQASNDLNKYQASNQSYSHSVSYFHYIICSLAGFQELSREENRELITKLDNKGMSYEGNPAYKYASAVSKIYIYPKASGGPLDIREKVQIGIGAAWETYQVAKANDQILKFFQDAFHGPWGKLYCFDERVEALQRVSLAISNPHFDDFNVKLKHGDTTATKIAEHYRVFKNEQILKLSRDKGLNYMTFKEKVDNDPYEWDPNVRDLSQNYLTKDNFAYYLAQNHQPVREQVRVNGAQNVVRGINFDRDKGFIEVNTDQIPRDLRREGAIVILHNYKEGGYYQASVHKINGSKIVLDLRGDPISRERWEQILDNDFMEA